MTISRSLSQGSLKFHVKKFVPYNFTEFVPWVAAQWELPIAIDVSVVRREGIRSSLRIRSLGASVGSASPSVKMKLNDPTLNIITYYNRSNTLTEIEIVKPSFNIPLKVIHILNITLPYHPQCYKINLKGLNIDCDIVYEIGNLLSKSNLTEVCFDNTFLPEGNYYTLLDKETRLEYLSLRNCKINSLVCETIASRIRIGCPAEKTLKILNLSSNEIGDSGAESLGISLRTNRTLLYLNICNNKLTDEGVRHILDCLMEFPLTYDEIIGRRKRFLEYIKIQHELFKQKSTEELENKYEVKSILNRKKRNKRANKPNVESNTKNVEVKKKYNNSEEEFWDRMRNEWNDTFSYIDTITKNRYVYSIGNFNLCYLNIAYNDIEYQSVRKLYEVLKYQSMNKRGNCGLLNVVLDGNKIPRKCELYGLISVLLKTACDLVNNIKPYNRAESDIILDRRRRRRKKISTEA